MTMERKWAAATAPPGAGKDTMGRGLCCKKENGAADQALEKRRFPGAGRRSSQS